jgi:hypothetical protein
MAYRRRPPLWIILPHMQLSYSVYPYDDWALGPPKRVSLTLFIQFGFSHNRRLEVFVLVVFFLLVIIVVGISRRHLVAYDSEETLVN